MHRKLLMINLLMIVLVCAVEFLCLNNSYGDTCTRVWVFDTRNDCWYAECKELVKGEYSYVLPTDGKVCKGEIFPKRDGSYNKDDISKGRAFVKGKGVTLAPRGAVFAQSAVSKSLAFSVGGGKGIETFRKNISEGYMPPLGSISPEMVFYDYRFKVPDELGPSCANKLFCPVCRMVELGGQKWLKLDLKSGRLNTQNYSRPWLNLIVVLDISASMSSPFDRYYYDITGKRMELEPEERRISKIEAAKNALKILMKSLSHNDYIGIITFNDRARLIEPIHPAKPDIVKEAAKYIEENIEPCSGTNIESGLRIAEEVIDEIPIRRRNSSKYETRILLITDMMPNMGDYSSVGIGRYIKRMEKDNVHITILGIGIDWNPSLTKELADIRGANFFPVFSPDKFKDLVQEEFDYMFFPLAYDLEIYLKGNARIVKMYGLDTSTPPGRRFLRINTIFPVNTRDSQARGSVLLALVKGETDGITVEAVYTLRNGNSESVAVNCQRTKQDGDFIKAVALAKYAETMQEWIEYELSRGCAAGSNSGADVCKGRYHNSLRKCRRHLASPWEQKSVKLCVSPVFEGKLLKVKKLLKGALQSSGDSNLRKDIEVVDNIFRLKGA